MEKNLNKDTLKRYLISSLVTFLSVFLATIAPQIGSLTASGFEVSVLVGIAVTGVRAGVKAVIEGLIILFRESDSA